MTDFYKLSDAQLQQIDSALLTAAGALTVREPHLRDMMIKASTVLDDIVEAADFAEQAPFSTYPEDREKLMALCRKVQSETGEALEDAADALADLVSAILEDEAV